MNLDDQTIKSFEDRIKEIEIKDILEACQKSFNYRGDNEDITAIKNIRLTIDSNGTGGGTRKVFDFEFLREDTSDTAPCRTNYIFRTPMFTKRDTFTLAKYRNKPYVEALIKESKVFKEFITELLTHFPAVKDGVLFSISMWDEIYIK